MHYSWHVCVGVCGNVPVDTRVDGIKAGSTLLKQSRQRSVIKASDMQTPLAALGTACPGMLYYLPSDCKFFPCKICSVSLLHIHLLNP